jgi:hypothetical protein
VNVLDCVSHKNPNNIIPINQVFVDGNEIAITDLRLTFLLIKKSIGIFEMVKRMKVAKIILFIILISIAAVITVNQAGAATVEFLMDVEYSGGSEPEGDGPWATATFVDSGPNAVTLTMTAAGLVDTEFISVWMFNIDESLDLEPEYFDFTLVGISGSTPDINIGSNAFKAGPDRFYDIEFDFPPPKGKFSNKFTSAETVTYKITYSGSGTMDAFSFNFQSTSDKHGPFYSAMHVQSIGDNGDSGWVGSTTVVPEPVSSILFLSGGAALVYRRFRRKE